MKAPRSACVQNFISGARTALALGRVVLALQADMWDPAAVTGDGVTGFIPIVKRIGQLARSFGKPVLLLEGDSHAYRVDKPFTPGDPILSTYDLNGLSAPNVTRIVVDGSSNANDYLKLSIDPDTADVFSWAKVPFTVT